MIRRINLNNFIKVTRSTSTLYKIPFQYHFENDSFFVSCADSKIGAYFPIIKRFYSVENQVDPAAIVDYNYVKKATSDKNILIVDVREPEELKEHGQIPNSINIPLGSVSTVLSSMSDEDFKQTYKKSKPKEDTEIIFYCMIGKRSGQAQQNTINLGYKNAKNYLGSWTDWASRS